MLVKGAFGVLLIMVHLPNLECLVLRLCIYTNRGIWNHQRTKR